MTTNVANQPEARRTKRKLWVPILVCLVILAVFAFAAGGAYWYYRANHAAVTTRTTVANDGNSVTTSTENTISSVADKVSPSVVSIVTSVTTQSIYGASQEEAAGTGIIISKDGYVLTNKHVVSGASTAQVVTNDGTTYENVQIVGTDSLNDVAYLKISGVDNLTAATIGDSATTRVGQEVVAIGNALGQYQNTVSSGIISGKGRPVSATDETGASSETLTDLLQTDAAINSGNSGGPLLNTSGQVIGMNTAVASNAEGIGFAIPINATKGTTKMVLAGKGVQHAYLGVQYVSITAAIAKQYSLSSKQGAYVTATSGSSAVVSGSPADKAGLQEKDIITKINDETIGTDGGMSSIIGEYAPGDTVQITYLRGGTEHTTNVTLVAYQAS